MKKVISAEGAQHFICCRKSMSSVFIQKVRNGFSVLNSEKLPILNGIKLRTEDGKLKPFELLPVGSIKKRVDSPSETKVFDIVIDGISKSTSYPASTYEIRVINDAAIINTPILWKKQVISLEEN